MIHADFPDDTAGGGAFRTLRSWVQSAWEALGRPSAVVQALVRAQSGGVKKGLTNVVVLQERLRPMSEADAVLKKALAADALRTAPAGKEAADGGNKPRARGLKQAEIIMPPKSPTEVLFDGFVRHPSLAERTELKLALLGVLWKIGVAFWPMFARKMESSVNCHRRMCLILARIQKFSL